MTTILFYFLIVLALAGSSYYGWKSAKSAKNRQETQEQKRLRSVLLFVNVLLFAGFLSLVITILNDAFILTGHEGLLQQGLRMLLGSGVTVKSKGPSLTLFVATIDFLRMVVNIGFLLCLRAFLINLYRSDIFIAKNARLVRWSAHLLVLGTFINNGIFTFGTGNQSYSFFNISYLLVSFVQEGLMIIVNLDVELAKKKMRSGELAERIGITPANLSVLKTGKAKAIRFTTLDAICKELDCQPGDILEYRPDEEN